MLPEGDGELKISERKGCQKEETGLGQQKTFSFATASLLD